MGAPIVKQRNIGPAPKVDLLKGDGSKNGTMELDANFFAIEPNVPVMHQVVTAQLAAARAGTQSTKTRAEVAGGGAKPWRQKGTGRARQGSIRAPHFSGGGVAHGPKPRDYSQKTPKKMVQLALRSALSDRAGDDKIIVVDDFGIDVPSTKKALAALKAFQVEGKVLVVLGPDDENVYLSLRNVPGIHVVPVTELNTFDVLRHDFIVFSKDVVPGDRPDSTPVKAPARKPAADTTETEGAAE